MAGTVGLILAAGKSKRMRSAMPKVLHEICWRPMVWYVQEALRQAGLDQIVAVVAEGGEGVRAALGTKVRFVVQREQLGTGDAVRAAMPALADAGIVVVLYGDLPLLTGESVKRLVAAHADPGGGAASASLLTSVVPDPTGFGRIVRDGAGGVSAIVEHRDCGPEEALIREVNVGVYCFSRAALEKYLPRLDKLNAQGEYEITDLVGMLRADGLTVRLVAIPAEEVVHVSSRAGLAAANDAVRRRELERLMDSGVTVLDPPSTYVAAGVEVGSDSVIGPQSYLLPGTRVGGRCVLGPGAFLAGATLADGVRVVHSTVEHAQIGPGCSVGPYAHIRPGTVICSDVRVGNFAEIKNSYLGTGTRAAHHCYVGDADLGAGVNVGAGAVFANYDGVKKHRTVVDDGSFIGCNVNLVAPLVLGRRSYVACGSTITKDVPAEALAVARERQRNIEGWVRTKFAPDEGASEETRAGGPERR